MYALRPQNTRTTRIRFLPKLLVALSLLGLGMSNGATSPPGCYLNIDNSLAKAYIDKHLELAKEARRIAGIPISIKLGQGILESSYGRSELATKSNNHFGITCKRGWNGGKYYYKPQLENREICFRSYSTVKASYEDHSALLSQPHYNAVRLSPATDYKAWALGLKEAGYAEDEHYATKLINIIERLNLDRFDLAFEEEAKALAESNTVSRGNQVVIRQLKNQKAKAAYYELVEQEMRRSLASVEEEITNIRYRQDISDKNQAAMQEELKTLHSALDEIMKKLDAVHRSIDALRRGQLDLAQRQSDVEDDVAKLKNDPFHTVGMAHYPDGPRFPVQKADARGVFYINGREAIAADGEQTLTEYGYSFNCDGADLVKYNDFERDLVLPEGYYIFLGPKRNTNDQAPDTHQVQEGETMHSISSRYGVRLQRLLQRNNLEEHEEPAVNEYLFINSKNPRKPKVKAAIEVGKHQRFINMGR